jgi:RHS repeat-associated protein
MLNMRYNYSTTGDNGRLTSTVDGISGETVTYAYDQLNRLASATSSSGSWAQQYSYDGFGNLTGMNGAATWSFDPATNHQSNTPTDANGNALPTNTWDVENRLVTVAGVFYAYDPWGKRVSQTSTTTDTSTWTTSTQTVVYFYGITGQRLQQFNFNTDSNGNTTGGAAGANLYFGRKLIGNGAGAVATDRLGSVRAVAGSNLTLMSYYPYGQERPQSNGQTTPNGTDKFATYFRDAVGQDYADQRYYNQAGRFFSPDPGGLGTADPSDPGSWNRYAYVGGDPVNFWDPRGSRGCTPGEVCFIYNPPDGPPPDPGSVAGGSGGSGGISKPCEEMAGGCGTGEGGRGGGGDDGNPLHSAMMYNVMINIAAALSHSDCSGIFGTAPPSYGWLGPNPGSTPGSVLNYLLNNNDISFGQTQDPAANAETTPNTTFFSSIGATTAIPTIVINNTTTGVAGATGFWNLSGASQDASTLLHELGHVLYYLGWKGDQIVPETPDPDYLEVTNNQVIASSCAKYFIVH